MWSSLLSIASLVLLHPVLAFCPPNCECDDETLVVSCTQANLDVIPITLNPSIQRLVLKYNKIKTVDSAIQFYSSLQYVDLSHNQLVNIPIKGFEPQEKLVELQLNHNKLSSVNNKTFIGLKSLKVLNLRGNFLEDLPDSLFAPLSHLEELDLGQNRISRIDRACFEGLTALRILYLDDNQLRSVPTPSFTYLGMLAELRVGLNVFSTLGDGAFNGLGRLSTLDLRGAGLTNITDNAFRGLQGLRSLVLTDNRLLSIPTKQLSKLNRLEDLEIGQNGFSMLESGCFKGLSYLRTLEITGASNLTRVRKGAFLDNLNLESLTLNKNPRLKTIEEGALVGLPNLHHLNLKENAFTSFSESMLAWPELRSIDIADNPIECGCNILWLREMLVRRNTTVVSCNSPAPLKYKSLVSLNAEELGCSFNDAKKQAIIGALCGTAVAIIAIICLLLYKYRHRLQGALKDYKWNKRASRKEHEYQKTFSDDEFIMRTQQQTMKPIPVTEL
uniref:Leucine-rich repeat neuronal protein 2 n=1 Tax=Cacopsylla melanoneura TaxID=428564 RepID=A0A8D8V0Y6_9HEMI